MNKEGVLVIQNNPMTGRGKTMFFPLGSTFTYDPPVDAPNNYYIPVDANGEGIPQGDLDVGVQYSVFGYVDDDG